MFTREDATNWVAAHIDQLLDCEAEYLFVLDSRVVAHGHNYRETAREAADQGYCFKIENGKAIEVYEVPGFSIVERSNEWLSHEARVCDEFNIYVGASMTPYVKSVFISDRHL
jgi:hypothetical protein